MGTFAALFQKSGVKIPDDKMEEFKRRIEKLFQAGGMMEVEQVQLCDKQVSLLKKASMHDYGMDFYYNYFEDNCWENAGFSTKSCGVWSEKIGWGEFHKTVVAAYVLESLYLDGSAIAMVDGEFVTTRKYTGWINYVFQENYQQKNQDPWGLFEALHDQADDEYSEDLNRYGWAEFIQDVYGLIGYYEIRAVLMGTDVVDEEFGRMSNKDKSEDNDKKNFFDYGKILKKAVREYHKESKRDEAEQFSLIMEMLRLYYEQDSKFLNVGKNDEDKELEIIGVLAVLVDAPAYVVKVISEIYERDFWTIWEEIKGVAKKRLYQYAKVKTKRVMPVSTKDFFGITDDDMILFWGHDRNIQFSQELKKWFDDLKDQFEDILKEEFLPQKPLQWILELMEYADENYYRIYTFSSFFEETIECLSDRRFLALWMIYDRMLHDSKMEEEGSVIFVPDGPEYEHIGLHYWGTPPRRRLKTNWDMMNKEEKNNKARVTFRRYMALLENRKLRKEVFGF